MTRLSSGARLEVFDTLDSTSAEAKRRIAAGDIGPLWIVAHTQTAGYGRRGRAWESQHGNFSGTLLFEPAGEPSAYGQLSFVAGLAVLDALNSFAHEDVLSLKWPNDILTPSGKLAGLLLERHDHGERKFIAVGVGVNLAAAPKGLEQPTASLRDFLGTGCNIPSPEDFAGTLDQRFHELYQLWRNHGMEMIRPLWLARAHGIGEKISVRLPKEEFTGVFGGIDETGALVLLTREGSRLVSAGEVMFGE